MIKIYKFMFEENIYDTKKAKEVLAKVDTTLRLVQKVLFWLLALIWFFSIFESLISMGTRNSPTTTGGFIFMSLVMFLYAIALCVSRVITLIAGAIIRLVELNEQNKITN